MIILTLLSGVALFLFGMSLMGDGLKSVAGNKLELVLYKLTNTPIKGLLLGTAVTAIIQSSSAVSYTHLDVYKRQTQLLQQDHRILHHMTDFCVQFHMGRKLRLIHL